MDEQTTDQEEDQKEMLPLHERIDVILDEIIARSRQFFIENRHPFSQEKFCRICGMSRLDTDPTGITCGNPRCLAGVRKIFLDTIEQNRVKDEEVKEAKTDIAETKKSLGVIAKVLKVDILDCDLDGSCDEIRREASTIKELLERREAVDERLQDCAVRLGLTVKAPIDPLVLCEGIAEEILLLKEKIERLEKLLLRE